MVTNFTVTKFTIWGFLYHIIHLGKFSWPEFQVNCCGDYNYNKASYGGIGLASFIQMEAVGMVTKFTSSNVATVLFKRNVALYRDTLNLGNIEY